MKTIMTKLKAFIMLTAGLLPMLLLTGCSTPKDIAYFQDVDTAIVAESAARRSITLRPEDKLSIIVSSKDSELAAMFNLPMVNGRIQPGLTGLPVREGGRTQSLTADGFSYYTVNNNGDIDFPVLGLIHVEGMTRSELASYIKNQIIALGYIKDPVVTIEFQNLGISVLGEVSSPGRYSANRDHISVLDALAMAGDLTIQGQRQNVLVVRDADGKRETYRLDLTKGSELLQSPAYYLQQDDIVYVEPNSYRKRQTTVNGNNVLSASFWVSVASLLTSIAVLIVK